MEIKSKPLGDSVVYIYNIYRYKLIRLKLDLNPFTSYILTDKKQLCN